MHSFSIRRRCNSSRFAVLPTLLVICAAVLAALVCVTLCSANIQQAYADDDYDQDNPYALLYDDGTLVFQIGNEPEAGRAIKNVDGEDVVLAFALDAQYSSDSEDTLPPWHKYKDYIEEIVFADKITMQTRSDLSNSATVAYFFYELSNCKYMDLGNFDCTNVKTSSTSIGRQGDALHMFDGCSSLVSLVLPSTFTNAYDIRSLFKDCSSLVSLDLTGLRASNNIIDEDTFLNCTSLRYILTTRTTWNNCKLDSYSGSTTSLSIPLATGKTWYQVANGELYNGEGQGFTDVPFGNDYGKVPNSMWYTTNDPLPLSECDLEVGWEDGSPDYYVATGESYPDSYDLPAGAKLNKDLDYTLYAYWDAGCTDSANNFEDPSVYYFRADQTGDYKAFSGSTGVVASMKPVTSSAWGGGDYELVLDDKVSFVYYFGGLTPSVTSSNPDVVSVDYTTEDQDEYTITLSPDAPTNDPVTITLGCTTEDGTELSISFDVTVAGERTSIDSDDFAVSVDALTYDSYDLVPQVIVTNTQTGDVLGENSYDLTYYSDSACENEVVVHNAGTYWVKVEGKNRYEGTKVQEFEVAKATPEFYLYQMGGDYLNNMLNGTGYPLTYGTTWSIKSSSSLFEMRYNLFGNDEVDPDWIVVTADVDDIELEYVDNSNLIVTPYLLGSVTVYFSIVLPEDGNYNDVTTNLYFNVTEASLTSADITATLSDAVYDGASHIPDVTVTFGDSVLVKDSDYELIYYSDEACQNVVSADDLVNVGTYYVKASGIGNYSGMTSAASFSIEKADGSLSVDPTTLDLDTEEGAGEVSVTYIGDGDIVVTSSDESIATATYANGVVIVTPVAAGTATISISAGEGTNYNAVSAVVVEVTVSGTEPQPTPEPGPAEPKAMTVYAGADRWQTANLIAAEVAEYGSYSGVIVCSGVNGKYADALSASGLSGVLDYPVVLTDGSLDGLDVDTATAVSALLGNSKGDIIVLGGTSTVSEGIEDGLSAYGSVVRVAGDDRYATSQAVYDYGSANGTWSDDYAVVAIGNNFPDALGAASFCTSQGVPMLLTNRDSDTLESYVQGAVSGVGEIVIAGGTTSIPDNKISNLKNTVRLAGDDRYATNLKFADWALENGMVLDGAGIATGTSFPDSLGSSYLLSITDSVLLLSSPTDNSALYDLLSQNADDINAVSVFGGENSVSTEVRVAIQNAIGGEWQVTTK